MKLLPFHFRGTTWHLGDQTRIMGIVNVTPDSFSDGGAHLDPDRAVSHALELVAAGAHLLDIGGESTRPGAAPVSTAEEIRRTIPVIEKLSALTQVPISIDTTKARVARAALQAGAAIVNDISGLWHDPDMLPLLAETDAGCILMHMRGTPQTMQQFTAYTNLTDQILTYFGHILERAARAGLSDQRIMFDPGIGFSKSAEQNLELIANTARFRELGRPLLLGPSRKSFLGKLLNQPDPSKRVWGTAGACACACLLGADVLRVHDVAEMGQVLAVADAIRKASG